MLNRGKYRYWIEILEKTETDRKDNLGENIWEYIPKKSFLANIESRIGSLLSGRPADTVMTDVTHKITYPYLNFPTILPDKHRIRFRGKEFNVKYAIDTDSMGIEQQVFCSERNV